MLTQRQKEALYYIKDRIDSTGIGPSFEEMACALGMKSKSGVERIVVALAERGFIRRLENRARAIEILRMPGYENAMPRSVPLVPQMKVVPSTVVDSRTISVPVMGRIAAGVPISAIQSHSHDIACPPDLLTSGEHFALEVKGDSMIDAGIIDGDMIVIRRCDAAENGDIVVALIEGEEATLKRLRKRGGAVALEAANPNYETRIFGPNQIAIIGRLVGLMRRY